MPVPPAKLKQKPSPNVVFTFSLLVNLIKKSPRVWTEMTCASITRLSKEHTCAHRSSRRHQRRFIRQPELQQPRKPSCQQVQVNIISTHTVYICIYCIRYSNYHHMIFFFMKTNDFYYFSCRFAWYQIVGEQVLAKGTVQNMTFTSVRSHHAGQYYCTASNPLGYQSSTIETLTVLCK